MRTIRYASLSLLAFFVATVSVVSIEAEYSTMIDLGDLGGYYTNAYGINDAGTIVGSAQDVSGRWQAVRWVPLPEPATVCLFAIWVAGGVLTKSRRRQLRTESRSSP